MNYSELILTEILLQHRTRCFLILIVLIVSINLVHIVHIVSFHELEASILLQSNCYNIPLGTSQILTSNLIFLQTVQLSSLSPVQLFLTHGLRHARLPSPPLTPEACSNSYPLSWWCHPTISSSVIPFSCLQSFPASGSFQWVSSSHQMTKVMEFQLQYQSFQWIFWTDFIKDGLTGSLCSPRNLKSLLQHHSSKASIPQCSALFIVQLSHPYTTTGKTMTLTKQTFVGKVMSLLFNMLSELVIAFLPKSKRILISWLQSPSPGNLETPQKYSQPQFPLFAHLFAMKWWDWMPRS